MVKTATHRKMKRYYKRRHRQVARLIYHYCFVKYLKRNKDGKWVTIDEFWQEYFDEIRE